MLSLKRKYSKLICGIFLAGSIITLYYGVPESWSSSTETEDLFSEDMVINMRQPVLPRPPVLTHKFHRKPPPKNMDLNNASKQEDARSYRDTAHVNISNNASKQEDVRSYRDTAHVQISNNASKQVDVRSYRDTAHVQISNNASKQVDVRSYRDTAHVKISSQTSHSYRALPHITGWMETNKMHDDYNFCPRIEPFLGPFNYVSKTKNPCWNDTGTFRCLPYFYIVGFSKCGTSDLVYKIVQHPDVIQSGIKEKHWFDYFRFGTDTRFIQNYTDTFAIATSSIVEELHQKGFSHKIAGDGTPCYVWGSLNWPCYEGNKDLDEPIYTNADVIHRLNPKAKIIISMREPVSRLYSRMLTWIAEPLHPVYVNSTPEKFHTFIKERIQMYRQCFQQWSHRHCAYNGSLYKEAVIRLAEGAYSIYVKDWLKVFPREQLLFIKFDDYITDMNATLKKVYSFLELAPLSETDMEKILHSGTANKGKFYHVGPMLNETRDMLEDFYQPFNEELAQILDDPHYTWKYKGRR